MTTNKLFVKSHATCWSRCVFCRVNRDTLTLNQSHKIITWCCNTVKYYMAVFEVSRTFVFKYFPPLNTCLCLILWEWWLIRFSPFNWNTCKSQLTWECHGNAACDLTYGHMQNDVSCFPSEHKISWRKAAEEKEGHVRSRCVFCRFNRDTLTLNQTPKVVTWRCNTVKYYIGRF